MSTATLTTPASLRTKPYNRVIKLWIDFLAASSPTAAMMLYLKHTLLVEGGYWGTILTLDLPGQSRHPDSIFTFLQKLSFYRWDLLIVLVLVPAAFTALSRVLRVRTLLLSLPIFNAGMIAGLWIQRTAWFYTGRFLTASLMSDGIVWSFRHPHDLALYALPSTVAKLVVTLAIGVLLPLGVLRLRQRSLTYTTRQSFSTAAAICALAVVAASFGPWLAATPFQSSAMGLILKFSSATADRQSERLASATDAQITAEYRLLSNSPELTLYKSPLHGKARGFDLIVWVCETLPMKAVAARGGLGTFPNLARLTGSAWLANEHYTTAPYSSAAGFSLLTSMYPPNSLSWIFQGRSSGQLHETSGLLSELGKMGYETEVFFPGDASFDSDLELVRTAGAKKTFISDVHLAPYEKTPWQRRLQLDQTAFAELKKSVDGWTQHGTAYAALFFPQVGHAPWENITGLTGSPTRLQLGEALMGLQDRWLGELIDLLARRNRLEKTLILVTGDHGIRTLNEDPALPRAMLDEYSFHVPLMLYAPGALSPRTRIDGLTSHLDVAPSLLDLLGASVQPPFFQGLPFWDSGIASRKVFFLGSATVGSDGLHLPGKFYAMPRLSGLVFGNSVMQFPDQPLGDPRERSAAVHALAALQGLQGDWIQRATR
jgi:phosphoglycerol transferase MdoB-like AlkP superfamily enzyme